jgi:hypothetical protein
MSTSVRAYRVSFIIVSVFVLATVLLALTVFDEDDSDRIIQSQKVLLDSLQREQEFYHQLQVADALFLLEEDYRNALEAYKRLLPDDDEHKASMVNSRIAQVEKVRRRPTDNGELKHYEAIIEKNTKSLDSLKTVLDFMKSAMSGTDSLRQRIQLLNAEVAKKNQELNRKQLIQVISFKNANGRLIHYLGEVVNGKANGGGVGIWNTGSIYRGEWKDNKRHGKGTFEWADGEKYVGEYKDDKRDGIGTYNWPSGERYEGEWRNDMREGTGKLFDQDGNIKFEGRWMADKPNR